METNQFDTFIGRKVLVKETKRVYSSPRTGNHEYVECDVAEEDTVIAEISKQVGDSHLRVWLPGMMGTMDYRTDRLNVHVEKQDDGSYEVTRVNWG